MGSTFITVERANTPWSELAKPPKDLEYDFVAKITNMDEDNSFHRYTKVRRFAISTDLVNDVMSVDGLDGVAHLTKIFREFLETVVVDINDNIDAISRRMALVAIAESNIPKIPSQVPDDPSNQ